MTIQILTSWLSFLLKPKLKQLQVLMPLFYYGMLKRYLFCSWIILVSIGEWPVSVSNTWNGTKLLMDDAIPEITQFKQRLNE